MPKKMVQLAVIVMVALMEADECSTKTADLAPSLFSLQADQPALGFYGGVQNMNTAAKTPQDSQAGSNCIKNSAYSLLVNFTKDTKLPCLCYDFVANKIHAITQGGNQGHIYKIKASVETKTVARMEACRHALTTVLQWWEILKERNTNWEDLPLVKLVLIVSRILQERQMHAGSIKELYLVDTA
eukprot:Gb_01331 [translate_table: standard]